MISERWRKMYVGKKDDISNNMQEHLVITMRWHFTEEPRTHLNNVSVS